MSDEQNKDSLLVEQEDALGFYFDSLLLPDENGLIDNDEILDESDDTETSSAQAVPDKQETLEPEEAVDKLQAAKDFLRASQERQGKQKEQKSQNSQVEEKSVQVQPVMNQRLEETLVVQERPTSKQVSKANIENEIVGHKSQEPNEHKLNEKSESNRKSERTITKGPVSPKPRLKESQPENEIVPPYNTPSSKIVFSSKNDSGEVSEQVLIPRSLRLSNTQKTSQSHSLAKEMPQANLSQTQVSQNNVLSSNESNKTNKPKDSKPQSEKQIESKGASIIEKPTIDIEERSQTQTEINEQVLGDKKILADERPLASHEPILEKEPANHLNEFSAREKPPLANEGVPLAKQSASQKEVSNSNEAPNIDLSLFLPKIKTLSEEEIAQQIEALTQAAVSQAQLESDLAHVAELEQVSQKILKTQSEVETDETIRNIDNAPSWAVPNFQVLLFTVAGLKLAVPLTELNGIVEWGDEYITELPGHKSWYLGIIQNLGKNVPVIDTLQQVVPKNRWPANHLTERKFKHIIMIDDAHWGLACETVLEVVTLKTDSVKWRSSRTKRRWLLGTVIEHMCALLDSSEFAAMLKTGDDSLLSS
ncbi:MAG: chemotaxis protein CheW [Gammaproteobacteria bacterium]|nr:chemotaxis protein CheW [Gammaproteobacteria bacterium]